MCVAIKLNFTKGRYFDKSLRDTVETCCREPLLFLSRFIRLRATNPDCNKVLPGSPTNLLRFT